MWFDDWSSIGAIVVKAAIGFVGLVFLLRLGGKRTLAKLNAFDLVITFTVGSLLASMIISANVEVAEGLAALVTLIAFAVATSFISSRSRGFQKLIKSDPTLLVYDGRYLNDAMRRERIAEVEIASVIRQQGYNDVKDVKAVVLESEGEFSVLSGDVTGVPASLSVAGIDTSAWKEPQK